MRRHGNDFLNPYGLLTGLIIFLIVSFVSSCDKHKYSKNDETRIIKIKPSTEVHAQKGIELSEEDVDKTLLTIQNKGLMDVTTTPR